MPGRGLMQIALDQRLGDDPHLPFLETAWSRRKMTRLFNREVLPLTYPGRQAAGVKRKDVAYTPGRKCVIRYSLNLDGAQGSESRWAVVSFAKDDRLKQVYRGHYSLNGDGRAANAVYLPQYRCLVEIFPCDWRLPSLPLAMQPGTVAPLLRKALDAGDATSPSCSKVKVLRYRPHYRCVLRYATASSVNGRRQAVGKLYPSRHEAQQVWDTISRLHRQGIERPVFVPRPLGMNQEWNMLLMERVPGVSMKRMLFERRAPGEVQEVVKLGATALATVHSLCFESEEIRSWQTELEKLHKRTARLRLVAPSLADNVEALLVRAEEVARGYTFGAPSLIHGDCKPSQLLIDQGRVAFVDYDMTCLGDPAIDVGNFMAQFRKYALSTGESYLRRWGSSFLAEYQARSSADGLTERALLFEALSLVRMAVRKFRTSPRSYARKGQSSPQVLLLREAAVCLAQL